MDRQLACRHVFGLLAIFVLLGTSLAAPTSTIDTHVGFMNTCDPCGQVRIRQEAQVLKRKILSTLWSVESDVVNALIRAMNDYKVYSLSHSAFDLTSCCGYSSFLAHLTDVSQLNKAELISKAMLLINDVITTGKAPSIDNALIQNMNNTLCALRTVDSSQTVETCLQLSPLDMCNRGTTCDVKVTLSFLKDAFIVTRHLARQGI